MPASQHLRIEEGDGSNGRAAKHGPQPAGRLAMAQAVLDHRHRPHRHDADEGRSQAEEKKKRIIVTAQRYNVGHLKQGLGAGNCMDRQISAQGGGGDGRQRLQRVAADDQLEGVECAGERDY